MFLFLLSSSSFIFYQKGLFLDERAISECGLRTQRLGLKIFTRLPEELDCVKIKKEQEQ